MLEPKSCDPQCHSINANKILVNDYLFSLIHNNICSDVDMISNIVQPQKLRNFHIFDNTDALNIHLSLREINSEQCQSINLPCSNTRDKEIVVNLRS